MTTRLYDLYCKEICPALKKKFEYSSVMEAPRMQKIVLSIGAGSVFTDSAKMEQMLNALTYIGGQKACFTVAKKSVAGFKVREGMKTGMMVTLRKKRMYEFLDRLRNMVLPNIREFKGWNAKSINGKAFSFGLKDYTIFPEIREFLKNCDIHGMNLTFVFDKGNDAAIKELLLGLGFPFID